LSKKLKFDTSNLTSDCNVRELGNRKKFHTSDLVTLKPKTQNQRRFLEAYFAQIPIILQTGCAGTGKSLLAIYGALSEVFDEGTEYKKLMIIRSAVDTRPIGFLPGELTEKSAPYELPYRDLIDSLLVYNRSYDNLKALGYLDFRLTTHIRGLTFDNTIMVVDEVQNMDEKEILSVLTRIGVHSKVVICGDSRQDDLFRQKFHSGFNYLERLMKNIDSSKVAVIDYNVDDIVRSDIVRDILIADFKTT
jgi:phosphate starvation-inducible PhoH-like protein